MEAFVKAFLLKVPDDIIRNVSKDHTEKRQDDEALHRSVHIRAQRETKKPTIFPRARVQLFYV